VNDESNMKILSLEFSSDRRSAALISDGKTLGSTFETSGRQTHAAGLIQSVLAQGARPEESVGAIVIGLGPGSYAGIRAAIAFTQGWQLARRIKVAGVSSVELMAVRCWLDGVRGGVDVAVDAQRGDFYLGCFEISGEGWIESESLRIVSGETIGQRIKADRNVLGPDAVLESMGGLRVFPRAEDAGRIPFDGLQWVESETLQPVYLRESNFVKAPPSRIFD